MDQKKLVVSYQTFKSLNELSASDQELCLKAEEALKSSYSSYSNFKVGVAFKLSNKQLVLGSNQENVAYPSGLLCRASCTVFLQLVVLTPKRLFRLWQLLQKAVILLSRNLLLCKGACLHSNGNTNLNRSKSRKLRCFFTV